MNKITTTDLLMLIFVLVFFFETGFANMTTIHWIGSVVSIIWVLSLIAKLIFVKDDS